MKKTKHDIFRRKEKKQSYRLKRGGRGRGERERKWNEKKKETRKRVRFRREFRDGSPPRRERGEEKVSRRAGGCNPRILGTQRKENKPEEMRDKKKKCGEKGEKKVEVINILLYQIQAEAQRSQES